MIGNDLQKPSLAKLHLPILIFDELAIRKHLKLLEFFPSGVQSIPICGLLNFDYYKLWLFFFVQILTQFLQM